MFNVQYLDSCGSFIRGKAPNQSLLMDCLMGAILNCVFILFQEQPLPEPAAPGSAASHRGVQSGSARLQVPDKLHIYLLFYTVLLIHDIVVRIRIHASD
jgi:hypothetical protein